MPVKGKLPDKEKVDNRTKIILLIMERSMTNKELLHETEFSSSTLANHLKSLMREELIEKAIENNRIVYRIVFDERKWESEYKKMSYDAIMPVLKDKLPSTWALWTLVMKVLVKSNLARRKKVVEGDEPLLKKNEISQLVGLALDELMKEARDLRLNNKTWIELKEIVESSFFHEIDQHGVMIS